MRWFGVSLAVVAAVLPGAAGGGQAKGQLHLRHDRLRAPGADLRRRATERARSAVRGREGRRDPRGRKRQAARAAVPRSFAAGSASDDGEQGLLSVAFHPRYATNHRFFVDYTDKSGDTRVVEFRSNGTVGLPGTARQILFVNQPYSNHNGGQLQFGPDRELYVGMGDGGSGGDPKQLRAESRAAARQAPAAERGQGGRRAGRSPATACATRGASPGTGPRVTSTSAMSARATGRRSTCARRPSSAG